MSRLDFIDGHTTVIANFRPDARGTITLCRSQLGQGNILQLVVLSNDQQVSRQIVLPSSSPTLKLRDLRHRTALDPNGTYVSAKNVSFLNPPIATPDSKPISVTVEMGATSASELEIVGSLRKLYTLMITLGGKTLNEEHKKLLTCFKFLTRWHSLDMEDKLRLYDQWACHELNFWLFKRDRGFFERVAKPFIQNKIHRTFLDDYLLDMPLNAYISSFQRFNQLNVAEQCLLVKKIGGESEHARTLEDAVKDAPIDRKEFEQLFGTVLAGSALNEVNEISDFQPQATASYVGSAGFDVATSALVNNADRDRDRIRSQVMKNNEECDQDIEFGLFDCYDDAEDAEMEVEESKPATNAEEVKHTGLLKLRQLALSRRQALYQNQRPTEELAETHYWGLSVRATTPKLVTVNAFWADYAKWTGKEAGSFLSENFIYATKNFTEIMFVLALLELPLNEPVEPEIVAKDARVSFRSTTPAVIFHKELKQCSISASDRSILVIQNYFVDADRIYYEYDDNKTGRKYIDPKDFRRHIVYGCHIVLTNTSSIRQTIELFFQIPVGAVPVKESQYIVTQLVDMKPFTIWQDEYFFYFPKTGSFPHLPVYVSKSGELLAHSPTTTVIVTDKPRPIDRTSWTTIAIHGSSEDVLGFLEAENLNKVQLDKITWRAKGRDFCVAVTDILRKRNEFDDDLWAYGFFHELPKLMREYLEQKWWSQFSGDVFYFLRSPLLNVRADETGNFLHLDYYPLVNARVHHVRRGNRILNNSFLDQYHHFLKFISRKPQLESADLLSIVIYLLLQDRLEEAQTFHELLRQRVESANGTILQPQLQLDYLAAFFEFYVSKDVAMEHPETIDFAITRELTRHYRDYPVLRWRGYFDEMARFLEEVDGHRNASAELAIDEREELRADQLNERLARQQPSFDFEVKDDMIVVSYLNVDELTISYYVMNVEMTFSTSPFVGHEGTGNHTFIAPNYCETHKIPAPQTPDDVAAAAARESGNDEDEFAMVGGGAAAPRSTRTFRIPLAPRFRHANIMLEMVGAGITRSLAHYAHALTVQIAETYGYLRVSHRRDGNPVPAAYVKVYAKMTSGKVRFWRDGYTALNGSFEYASLSEKDSDGKSMLGKVRRFAILVQGDDFGAVVKEVGPPKA
ncbi:hypothetical protein BC938DRAFT_473612 [Jimgerdemannia flammicorona]|uniref:Uncharacterized protein n=1 Tax=Jimgerdemannia flammicorona TaxID=994334 RepID=A0A433Q425_9FUNG|nr:hypothetical protein BC938DRAFT_473612 [Jimgerdemannia flammicorona]